MKTYFWVFAIAVFVVSVARPALACTRSGSNPGRYASTKTPPPAPTPPAPTAGTAQGAGMLRN